MQCNTRKGSPLRHRITALLACALSAALLLSGCQVAPRLALVAAPAARAAEAAGASSATSGGPSAPADKSASQLYTAHLEFSPSQAQPGATVEVRGSGYPRGADVELIWYTVEGHYQLDQGTEFVGQRYDERKESLATVRADNGGNIRTTIQAPLDYGGSHDVRGRVNGQEISQAGLTIQPTFSLSPREGPVGTMIELRIAGVDWQKNINTWHVLYDNSYLGFMSAVTTRGVAVARFRAAGPAGSHTISVWHNSFNPTPYLNWQQGPYKNVPSAQFTFRVTGDPGPPPAQVEDFSAQDNPWPVKESAGKLTLSSDRGTVGQAVTLRGSGLPGSANLTLRWWTMVGNRVSATGFNEEARDIGSAQTQADGTFEMAFKLPDDLGGQHRIEVVRADQVLAAAGAVIQPSVVSISPTKVQPGDSVKIHLKGVGWTTYDNTYGVTYDNSYIGYVCGFSTNGDVQFSVTATGAAGTHIIDLYPTIYKGQDPSPRVYSVPDLTYATDHPGRTTPAIRLAVEVAEK